MTLKITLGHCHCWSSVGHISLPISLHHIHVGSVPFESDSVVSTIGVAAQSQVVRW